MLRGGLPVLDAKTGNATEFAEVMGDDGGTEAERLGCDERIEGTYTFAALFE